MARSIRLVQPDRREPPSRARHRAGHVTVGVMMTIGERDALAARAAAAGVSMGALLRGDREAREAELARTRKRARAEGLGAGQREREAEVAGLQQELAAAAGPEQRAKAAAAGWRAAFEVERDVMWELYAVVKERVPQASYRTVAGQASYLDELTKRMEARLKQIPAPPGGWPKG
ncbi:MAG TPA: hypothetical protein VNN74_06775 [Candidatus Micrarchaeia archaeon]|nr:hypothetical protein [Candidatus Micrarchaeia archaeon]